MASPCWHWRREGGKESTIRRVELESLHRDGERALERTADAWFDFRLVVCVIEKERGTLQKNTDGRGSPKSLAVAARELF